MSEDNTKNLIHPLTTRLVNEMKEITDALKRNDYVAALRGMRGVCITIEEKDRDKQLYTKILREGNQARGTESNRQYQRHLVSSAHAYWKWADQLNQLLYDRGYYSGDKFGAFHDPSGGRKSQ
jgi:hypothetical protein